MRFVPVTGLEQQGKLALHAARALLVKPRTTLANALRGLAAAFGLVEQVEAGTGVPKAARPAMRARHRTLGAVREAAAGLEEAVAVPARRD